MKKTLLLIASVLPLLYSCQNRALKNDVKNLLSSTITLPQNLPATIDGKDTLLNGFMDTDFKLVVWYDSIGCSSCQISKMFEWEEITAYAQAMREKFNVIFLFTPKKIDQQSLRIALRAHDFKYPVFIDGESVFVRKNPHLSTNKSLHTFLLDKNNQVILVGNPLNNPTLWKLYKEQMQ